MCCHTAVLPVLSLHVDQQGNLALGWSVHGDTLQSL